MHHRCDHATLRWCAQAWTNGLSRFFTQPVAGAPAAAPAALAAFAPFGPPAATIPPAQLQASANAPPAGGANLGGPGNPNPNNDRPSGPGAAAQAAAPGAAAAKALEGQGVQGLQGSRPPAGSPGAAAPAPGFVLDAEGWPAEGVNGGDATGTAPVSLNGAAAAFNGTGLNFYPNLINFEANSTRTMVAY